MTRPVHLLLLGLGFVILGLVPGFVTSMSRASTDTVRLLDRIGIGLFVVGALFILGGGISKVIEIGMRSSKDDR